MKPITKTEPYVLTSDDDGHWYFMPESLAARFESLVNMMGDEPEGEWDMFVPYQIDGPHILRVTGWLPY